MAFDPQDEDKTVEHVLETAIINHDVHTIERIIKNINFDINYRSFYQIDDWDTMELYNDDNGYSLFMLAIRKRNNDIINLFLESGKITYELDMPMLLTQYDRDGYFSYNGFITESFITYIKSLIKIGQMNHKNSMDIIKLIFSKNIDNFITSEEYHIIYILINHIITNDMLSSHDMRYLIKQYKNLIKNCIEDEYSYLNEHKYYDTILILLGMLINKKPFNNKDVWLINRTFKLITNLNSYISTHYYDLKQNADEYYDIDNIVNVLLIYTIKNGLLTDDAIKLLLEYSGDSNIIKEIDRLIEQYQGKRVDSLKNEPIFDKLPTDILKMITQFEVGFTEWQKKIEERELSTKPKIKEIKEIKHKKGKIKTTGQTMAGGIRRCKCSRKCILKKGKRLCGHCVKNKTKEFTAR